MAHLNQFRGITINSRTLINITELDKWEPPYSSETPEEYIGIPDVKENPLITLLVRIYR